MQLIDKPQEDRAAQASTMELKTYLRSGSQLGTLTNPQSKVSIFQLPFFGPERDATSNCGSVCGWNQKPVFQEVTCRG